MSHKEATSQPSDSQPNAVPDEANQDPGQPIAAEAAGSSTPSIPPGSSEIEDLQKRLADQTARAAELWDKLLRTTADFDNYKKRVAKERSEAAKYAFAPLLRDLLTVLDSFEMALAATGEAKEQTVQSLQTGVSMILDQFKKTLQDAGLSIIDAQGQPFDPNLHEAVSQFETSEVPEGQVFQQMRKGYRLHDRLLRPASVVVAKAPEPAPTAPSEDEPAAS